MIVGKPGIGKTYLLAQLQTQLLDQNILCLTIKIDTAYDSSDEAIQNELELQDDWIETLKEVGINNDKKAILIFDAFDAARDEEKRSGFLRQIGRAKTHLHEKWDIIVSVRTYDAEKSRDLAQIFSENNAGPPFYISELTNEEVASALTNDDKLNTTYQKSSPELKEVLRIPFFLKIFIEIVKKTVENVMFLSGIHSEIQLLDSYWALKIDNSVNHLAIEQFLTKFTRSLVENRTLSIHKQKFITDFSSNDHLVFAQLRSEDILDEVSHHSSRLAYSHNILFDYAVSRYCLLDDYKDLREFINEDISRPFFFRPSFLYFFNSLWYNKRETFWKLYQRFSKDDQKEIKLFVRLIFNGTIASEFLTNLDLRYLLDDQDEQQRNINIARLLQSIRFVREKSAAKDIDLFLELSEKIDPIFLFELAFLLDRAIADPEIKEQQANGRSARNVLNYIISHRQGANKVFLDRIGANRGVEMVSRVYSTNIQASSDCLRQIFKLIEEPNFDIHYFTSLAEYIKYILPHDAAFVSEVYQVIFGYTETSEDKTSMGNSVVMNLISNRKQDFEMCYYRLEKFYPEFLRESPLLAMDTGIAIVNSHLKEKKASRAHDPVVFEYRGKQAVLMPDYSSIWAEHRFGTKQEGIAQAAIDYIEELLKEGKKEEVEVALNAYTSRAQVGYLWKLLFKLAVNYPEQLFDYIFPLIVIPQLLASSETTFEMKEFIRYAVPLMSDEQVAMLERCIFDAFPEDYDYSRHASLSLIPKERLQLKVSKAFMEGREPVENEPRYKSTSSVSSYTTDEWLSDRGVDITEETNSMLLSDINKLDYFSHTFMNDTPEYDQQKDYLQLAIRTFDFFKAQEDLHQELIYSTLLAIAKTIAAFSRELKPIPKTEFSKIREIVIYCYQYNAKFEDEQNDKSAYGGYSPTPRIEVTSALIPIYIIQPDHTFQKLIDDAAQHTNGIVRYHLVRELPRLFNKFHDKYQALLFNGLENENDSFVYTGLLNAIYFKKDRVAEDGRRVIELADRKKDLMNHRNSFIEAYAELLLWFISESNLSEAKESLKSAYRYSEFCNTIIFKLFKDIHTYRAREIFVEELPAIQHKIEIISYYVELARIQIKQNAGQFDFELEENQKAIKLFDEVVTRIHFALERKQRIDNSNSMAAIPENRRNTYFLVKPILKNIIQASGEITEKGLIIGPTAHYFVQTLRSVLHFDPKDILEMIAQITQYSVQAHYTFDSFAIREIVQLTEQLIADHRDLLLEEDAFNNLISILEIYIDSGWVDALEMLWKLDDVFR